MDTSEGSMPGGVSNKLKVSNLHYEVTPQDLSVSGLFSRLELVQRLWLHIFPKSLTSPSPEMAFMTPANRLCL